MGLFKKASLKEGLTTFFVDVFQFLFVFFPFLFQTTSPKKGQIGFPSYELLLTVSASLPQGRIPSSAR